MQIIQKSLEIYEVTQYNQYMKGIHLDTPKISGKNMEFPKKNRFNQLEVF